LSKITCPPKTPFLGIVLRNGFWKIAADERVVKDPVFDQALIPPGPVANTLN